MTQPEVLVVGAGPTGLTLAAQLAAHGAGVRLIDRSLDRVHESRALAVQPRTLEVLAGLGITETLVAAGNPTVQLRLHARGRELSVPLFDLGLADTAYPYLLFLSQAETERILGDHLAAVGIGVERGVELVGLSDDPGATDAVTATLRHTDGRTEAVTAQFVVGCDGAHSTVRNLAGIGFEGAAYPQTFVLADTEADGITPGAAHVYLSGHGMLFCFPLGHPASWRLLAMRPPDDAPPDDALVWLDEVQALTDTYTGGAVRLRDPVWLTNFRLHNRGATRYRGGQAGRVFLAGDAARIHSPAGAQGMNTGIQDAVNLAWKLVHVLHGADPALLDTYETERAPIGRTVLRFTDRAFTIATSTNPIIRFARTRLAPTLIRLALKYRTGRAYAFRTIAQLGIHYRRSPLSHTGPRTSRRGPKPGDRLPDTTITIDGQPITLHAALSASGVAPSWHLLLCGPGEAWAAPLDLGVTELRLDPENASQALHRLGVDTQETAQILVRPDGHIGYRAGGTDLTDLRAYLRRWVPAGPQPGRPQT